MALSEDQRAMLRLLAKREEGYEDIAALKGLSVDEVRAEVKAALAELDAVGEAVPPTPSSPAEDPPPGAPPAEEPKVEAAPPPSPPKPSAPAKPPANGRQRPSVPVERRRFLALAGGALGVVAIVLIAIAVFGGSSDSSSAGSSGAPTETAAVEEEGKVTQAVLAASDGGDANGRAIFGRLGKKEIVLQVTAENLEPTAAGESYTVWLYRSPKLSLRVGSATVDSSGQLGARFPIPAELLAYVASGAFDQIYISRTADAAYQREVAQAKKSKSLPRYTGATVLTGEITGPVAKAGSNEGG